MGFRRFFSRASRRDAANGNEAASRSVTPSLETPPAEGDALALSELELDPAFHAYFELGRSLARLNATGHCLSTFPTNALQLNPVSGRFDFRWVEKLLDREYVPTILEQLDSGRKSFGPEPWRSVLSGYIAQTAIEFEPMVPGLVDAILAGHLAAAPTSLPTPAETRLAMRAALRECRVEIAVSDERIHVISIDADRAVANRAAAIMMLGSVALAGSDLSAVSGAMAPLLRDAETSGDGDALARAVDATRHILATLSADGFAAKQGPYMNYQAFETFRTIARELDVETRIVISELLSEGLDEMTRIVVDVGRHSLALPPTDISTVLLRGIAEVGAGIERRLAAFHQRYRALAWHESFAPATDDIRDILVHLAMEDAVVLLDSVAFAKSFEAYERGESRSFLWSAGERALFRSRSIAVILFGVSYNRDLDDDARTRFSGLAENTTQNYLRSVELYARCSDALRAKGVADVCAALWTNTAAPSQFIVRQELEKLPELIAALDIHGLHAEPTRRLWTSLGAMLWESDASTRTLE